MLPSTVGLKSNLGCENNINSCGQINCMTLLEVPVDITVVKQLDGKYQSWTVGP